MHVKEYVLSLCHLNINFLSNYFLAIWSPGFGFIFVWNILRCRRICYEVTINSRKKCIQRRFFIVMKVWHTLNTTRKKTITTSERVAAGVLCVADSRGTGARCLHRDSTSVLDQYGWFICRDTHVAESISRGKLFFPSKINVSLLIWKRARACVWGRAQIWYKTKVLNCVLLSYLLFSGSTLLQPGSSPCTVALGIPHYSPSSYTISLLHLQSPDIQSPQWSALNIIQPSFLLSFFAFTSTFDLRHHGKLL